MGKRSELCLVQQGRRKDDQLLDLRPLMVVHIEQSQPCSTNWKQILNIEMKLFCSSDFFWERCGSDVCLLEKAVCLFLDLRGFLPYYARSIIKGIYQMENTYGANWLLHLVCKCKHSQAEQHLLKQYYNFWNFESSYKTHTESQMIYIFC